MKKEDILKAGKIAKEVKEYSKKFIRKSMPLLEIAEKIEEKILSLGGKPAFPVNLSMNEIAAHYTPNFEDKTLAEGLLKVDLGVNVNGSISDTAFSIDLEGDPENKNLILAAEEALKNAIKLIQIKKKIKLREIGKEIEKTIESRKAFPIVNLCGHSMEDYNLHSGVTIPNIDNSNESELEPGLYAIEPFSTKGGGKVHDAKPSGIYSLINEKNIRNLTARKILEYAKEEYQTLPFCERWIVKKFGKVSLLAIKEMEKEGILYQYPQLVESERKKVAQAEETILLEKSGEVIITTD